MWDPRTPDRLEAARTALLALDRAETRSGDAFIDADGASGSAPPLEAIHLLDQAGAIEAALDADFFGNTRWRVRAVTLAGREVARLVSNDSVWTRLREDLRRKGNPFEILVSRYRDATEIAAPP